MTKVSNYPLQTYIQSLSVKLEDMLRAGGSISSIVNAMDVSSQNLNAAKIVVSVIPPAADISAASEIPDYRDCLWEV